MQIDINIKERNNKLEIIDDYEPIVCGNSVYRLVFDFDENWTNCANKTAILKLDGKEYCIEFSGTTLELPALPNANIMLLSLKASLNNMQLSTPQIKFNLIASTNSAELETILPYQNYHSQVLGLINKIEGGDFVVNEARTSLSQVSLFGNDEISGTKNFIGNLTKNGVDVATINQVSNPNLLINGDFKVNQRGKTTYTGVGSHMKYTVDRWIKRNNHTIVETTNDKNGKITLSQNNRETLAWINQTIEFPKIYQGKTLTFSVKISNTNLGSRNAKIAFGLNASSVAMSEVIASQTFNTTGIYSCTGTVPDDIEDNLLIVSIQLPTDASIESSITIDWAKLEIGLVATPFSPRPYAEELAMCQRYYEKIDTSISENKEQIITYARSEYRFYDGRIQFMVEKRVKPTIKLFSSNTDAESYLYDSTQSKDFRGWLSHTTTQNFLLSTQFGDISANDRCSGYFDADAEIY